MATGVDAKLLKSTKFPPEFSQKVDMTKVNLQVMKKWIAGKISEILGSEDDVVIELCFNLIEGSRYPDIKSLQIQLTGFLDKDTAPFCKESRPTRLLKKPAKDVRSSNLAVAEEGVASTATVVGGATETHTVAVDVVLGEDAVLQDLRHRPGEEVAIITADPPEVATHTCLAIDALHDDDRPRRTPRRPVLAPAHQVHTAVEDREDVTLRPLNMTYAKDRGLHCHERTITALAGGHLPQIGTRLRPSVGVTPRLGVDHLPGGGAAGHCHRPARTDGPCHLHEAHHAGDVTETAGAGVVLLVVLVESAVGEDAS
ncbi:hypothetical protein J7T55_008268 [Diaporthe amygdali]|uniref:uncharacterized protein n=1 Tax=Phomopsis amygdali TaxID=1214568 RepID=UPI0022FE6E35|nr:uncharacterized protein J7T55_008268 [Diaporthe amygdali]KAJ0121106.1 hypothetical protein J7T55_008268 [Diaporthe amygdali]